MPRPPRGRPPTGGMPPGKKGPPPGYQKWLEEQQRRRQEQAAADQARRAAEAARRRQEQMAREAAARRRAEAARRRAEAARRAEAQRLRSQQIKERRLDRARREVVVKRGDTPEGLAKMYGVSPQDVVSDVQRLRPGQRLQLGLPDYARVSASAAERAKANLEARGTPDWFDQELMDWIAGPDMGVQRLEFDEEGQPVFSLEPPVVPSHIPLAQLEAERKAQEVTGYTGYVSQQFTGHTAAQTYALEDHLARQQEWVQEQSEAEQWDRIQFAMGMRSTGQALAYVYEEMLNGNPNWQDILFVQSGPFEGNALILTDKMLMAFSPDQREKIWEMGYALTDDGYWAPQRIEEEGYGMGGYSYPGYGGGYGVGGLGDWEPTVRGGTYARVHGGGKTTKDVRKLFAASTPPSHWRI